MIAAAKIRETFYEPIFATSHGQVLRFLARHSGRSFYEQEIVEGTAVSRSAVNLAARSLWQAGLLHRQRRGRMNFYSADDHHPFVQQFKVLDTLARLEPLLQELRPLARRIVLFGSCAAGTNAAESDIDLFILSDDREQVMLALMASRTSTRSAVQARPTRRDGNIPGCLTRNWPVAN